MRYLPSFSALTLFSAASAGCAGGATPAGMVPGEVSILRRQPGAVDVAVTGGRDTNALWTSQIGSEDLAQAIRMAIEKHKVFAQVATPKDAAKAAPPPAGTGGDAVDWILETDIHEVSQPIAGFDMTVAVYARWSLVDARTNQSVWRTDITSEHTATVGDAFIGSTRLRLANEGAARANIQKAMEAISMLELSAPGLSAPDGSGSRTKAKAKTKTKTRAPKSALR